MANRYNTESMKYNLGYILQTYRRSAGITQKELADICELSSIAITNYETGKAKIPFLIVLTYLDSTNHTMAELLADLEKHLDGSIVNDLKKT